MDPSFMVENIETFRSERELKKKRKKEKGFLLEWFCPGLSNESLICGFEKVN